MVKRLTVALARLVVMGAVAMAGMTMSLSGVSPASAAIAGCTLYGATGGPTPSNLYILDPDTGGVLSTVGSIGFGVTGLAVDPVSGALFGSTANASLTSPRSLIRIDRATGIGTLIGPLGIPNFGTLADLAFDASGILYGFSTSPSSAQHHLYRVNQATGAATLIGDPGIPATFGGGLAFVSDTLYLAAEADNPFGALGGNLRTLNLATGATTGIVRLSGGLTGPANGIVNIAALDAASDGTLYGVDLSGTFGSANPDASRLITINPTTGRITILGASVLRLDAIAFFCPGQLQFDSPTYTANENGGVATIRVTRTGGNMGPVSVRLTTSNGTAQAGADYTAVDQIVTFAGGDVGPRTVQIPILDDALVEGNETVNLALTSPTGGASIGAPGTAVLTIIDNDTGGDLSITKTGPTSAGPGQNVVYTLTITNNGAAQADNVLVQDPTPTGLTFVSTSGACATTFPCALGAIPPGQGRTISAIFNVPAGYVGPNPIVNTATVSSSTADSNAANNTATVQTPVLGAYVVPPEDNQDKQSPQHKPTEEELLNAQHTNTQGRDHYATGGGVSHVERSTDGLTLLVTLRQTGGEFLVVEFACPRGECPDIIENDQIDVDGEQGGREVQGHFIATGFSYVTKAPRPR